MSTIIVYAVIALAFMGALGGIYAKGYYSGKATVTAEWQEANEKAREEEAAKSAAAAKKLEGTRVKQKVVYRTITQYVDKIVDRPVYRNVCLDADGLRCLGAAIKGESATGCQPDERVPAATPPHGDGR